MYHLYTTNRQMCSTAQSSSGRIDKIEIILWFVSIANKRFTNGTFPIDLHSLGNFGHYYFLVLFRCSLPYVLFIGIVSNPIIHLLVVSSSN